MVEQIRQSDAISAGITVPPEVRSRVTNARTVAVSAISGRAPVRCASATSASGRWNHATIRTESDDLVVTKAKVEAVSARISAREGGTIRSMAMMATMSRGSGCTWISLGCTAVAAAISASMVSASVVPASISQVTVEAGQKSAAVVATTAC